MRGTGADLVRVSGDVDQTEPLLAIGRDLHLILESRHGVLHVLARHAYVVVGDLAN
jgi:hypothetical protein